MSSRGLWLHVALEATQTLLLDTSLPKELSVCLEWLTFPSGVASWALGFCLDSDVGL